MNSKSRILDRLKQVSLNLRDAQEQDIEALLQEFGSKGYFGRNVLAGEHIVRVREIGFREKYLNIYCRESQISYVKDVSKIMDYNRASCPLESMFYGTIVDSRIEESHISAMFEAFGISKNYRFQESFNKYVMSGLWEVKRKFHSTAFIHCNEYHSRNKTAAEMNLNFQSFIRQHPMSELYASFSEFMSSQFYKDVDNLERYNYKISAVQTKYLQSRGIKSVIYPSVKGADGLFNIAIHPEYFENNYFQLKQVIVWRFYFDKGRIKVKSILSTSSFDDDGHFCF